MEIEERKEEDKIRSKNIYIQVDEDHVKERNKKGCTISKIITIYTKKRTSTKPDRIPEVKQIRKELVDKFTFSGLYKDTQEMWEDVAYYIGFPVKGFELFVLQSEPIWGVAVNIFASFHPLYDGEPLVL